MECPFAWYGCCCHAIDDEVEQTRVATVGAVLALAVAGVVAAYDYLPGNRQDLIFFVAVVASSAALYAAYFAGAALHATLEHQRQRLSIELDRDLHELDLTRLRSFLDEVELNESGQQQAYERILANDDLHAITRTMLNRFENIAVAIQVGAADELTLYFMIKSMVKFYYGHLHGYILHLRKAGDQPTAYVEVQKLARAWEGNESVITGRRLPERL
jgi:hypothetical protein